MSPRAQGHKWAASVAGYVRRQFGLNANIEQSKHVKVTFTDGDRNFLWVVASTPSDRNGKKIALSKLRMGLRQTFGVESIRALSEFPLQMAIPTEFEEQDLEGEWNAFFATLEQTDQS